MHELDYEINKVREMNGWNEATACMLVGSREDPIPYTMHMLESHERKCILCGPPFQNVANVRSAKPCTFACGKRYIVEVIAIPNGFRVKQQKTKWFPGTRRIHSHLLSVVLSVANLRTTDGRLSL